MRQTKRGHGFTLIELLVLAATLLVLLLVLLPGVNRAKAARDRRCQNNLRQIGFGFQTWTTGDDYRIRYPAKVHVNHGGAREFAEAGKVFFNFLVMSNQLPTPAVLVCPWDKERKAVSNFGPGLGDRNVSYFVGLDATLYPKVLVSGDRNLAFGGRPLGHGLFTLATNMVLTWTRDIHHSCGNLLLGDGGARSTDQEKLASAIQEQGIPINRLAIP